MAFLFRSKPTRRLAVSVTEQGMSFAAPGAASSPIEPLRLPEGWQNAAPAPIGALIREHLQAQGDRSTAVVVGLSPKALLARRIGVPTAEAAAVAGIVRLKVEREFSGGLRDLAFDYVQAPGAAGEPGVLLIGARSDRLTHLQAIFTAAGLSVQGIGATGLAMAEADAMLQSTREQATVSPGATLVAALESDGMTVFSRVAGRCIAMSTLSVRFDPHALAPASVGRLVSELTRAGAGLGFAPGAPLRLLDGVGLSEAAAETLVAALRERRAEVTRVNADGPAALLLAGSGRERREGERINLLRQRLTAPPPKPLGRLALGGLVAAVLLLLVGGGLGFAWIQGGRELEALRQAEATLRPAASSLEAVRRETRQAAGWFDHRPALLETLLELTDTFPTRGRIWVTQLSVSSETGAVASSQEVAAAGPLRGSLKCQAEDKDTMLAYLQAMQRSPKLSAVELRDWSTTGQGNRLVRFEIAFLFVPDGQGDA